VFERGAESGRAALVNRFKPELPRRYIAFGKLRVLCAMEDRLQSRERPSSDKTIAFVGANDGPYYHPGDRVDKLGNDQSGKSPSRGYSSALRLGVWRAAKRHLRGLGRPWTPNI